ncbi:hypothetical protein OG871_09485 [Kitasatospora sp. NBC_00374]|uniref:COG4315 family predicted lipoprotein n=1 Tax=Kitasatospora sp. NBC_00374 TaxID=2975964 RepID=UPI003246E319
MRRTRQAATFTSAALLVVTVGSCATEWRPLPPAAPTPTVTATVTATATALVAPAAVPALAAVAPAATAGPSGAATAPAAPGSPSPGASGAATAPASPAVSASPTPAAPAAPAAGAAGAVAEPGAAVAVASSNRLGPVLVDAQGRTLYVFEGDSTTMSTCYDDCASALPPLTTKGFPVAGPGADDGLLGTSLRADGTFQVLYNGRPLYLCAEDTSAGEVSGQELNRFGSIWYAADASGHSVKAPAPAEDSTG